jgi:hypothetical protein
LERYLLKEIIIDTSTWENMMDEYDMWHDSDYKDIIDIYSNFSDEKAREVCVTYVETDIEKITVEQLKIHVERDKEEYINSLVDAIKNGRGAIKASCSRYITQVGLRVRNKSKSTTDMTQWILIRVWRGRSGINPLSKDNASLI